MAYKDEDSIEEERIKKAKARKKQQEEEEEEEEERKKRRRAAVTEEDDENLRDDEDDEEDDDEEEDEEEQEEEQEEEKGEEQEGNNKKENKDNNTKQENNKTENDKDNIDSDNKNSSKSNSKESKSENGTESNSPKGSTETSRSPKGTGSSAVGSEVGTKVTANTGTTTSMGANVGVAGAETAGTVGVETAVAPAAAGGTAAGATAAWPVTVVVAVIIILIILIITVVGIIFFFIAMPGMVVDKIGNAITKFREGLQTTLSGSEAAAILVNREQVISAAEYLEQMGYDLKGYGFLSGTVEQKLTAEEKGDVWSWIKDTWSSTEPEESTSLPLESFSTKSLSERAQEDSSKTYQEVYVASCDTSDSDDIKRNILMTKDSDGNLTFVKSNKLAMYLAAENAIYLIRNYNQNWTERAKKIIGMDDPSEGSGLIYFVDASDEDVSDYIKNGEGLKFTDGETWLLNADRAKISRSNRTLKIKNSDDGVFESSWFTYNMDGWASLYGVPLQLSLALHLSTLAPGFSYDVAKRGTEDTAVKIGLIEQEDVDATVKILLTIDGVQDYWSYMNFGSLSGLYGQSKIYEFDSAENIPRSVVEALINAGAINAEDDPETEKNEEEAKSTEAQEAISFLDSTCGIDTQYDFTRYVPIILEVENHWYQDLSFENCYEWNDNSDVKEYQRVSGYADIVYIEVSAASTVTQINDATAVGEPGEWIKNLIDNQEYTKYDGVGVSEEVSKINFKDTAVDAIAMLEQIQGEDAQEIIRMFKELMASYNIYFEDTEGTQEKKELFSKVIRDYTGKLLTDGEDCVYRANMPPTQKGFDKDKIVQAPCNGKITYRTNNAICIEIDAPDKTYDDYTILISGFKVNDNVLADTNIEEGTELGLTIVQDLKLVLRDENGAIVKNDTVISTGEDEDDDDEADTIDEQTAMMYGYTEEELNTLYAVIAQEGGTSDTTEIKAVTTCMMLRAIRAGMYTDDGEHYSAYDAATESGQFEAYGAGHYEKYMPDGESYRYINEKFKSVVNSCLSVTSESQLFHHYYFFLANEWYQQALNNCKSGTVPYKFTENGNWFYNNAVSYREY